MSTPSNLPFPELTPIDGKPHAASIARLKKELCANARAIHADLGGGVNGHLGLAMPAAQCFLRAGAAFAEPAHPGPLPVHPAGSTQAFIVATNRTYDANLEQFRLCQQVKQESRLQILGAVQNICTQQPEDPDFGCADATVVALMQHLATTHASPNANDSEKNHDRLKEPWNPDEPFENLWKKITKLQTASIFETGLTREEERSDKGCSTLCQQLLKGHGLACSWPPTQPKKRPGAKARFDAATHTPVCWSDGDKPVQMQSQNAVRVEQQ